LLINRKQLIRWDLLQSGLSVRLAGSGSALVSNGKCDVIVRKNNVPT
jgi:hypothetical protein